MRLNCEDLNRIVDVRVYVNDVLESSVYNNGHTIELYVPERSILLLMARKNKKREAGSGSITKRKDGRWQGQYVSGYDPETGKPRRHTIYGQTQKEVAEKLRAATSSIDNGTFQEPRKITVAEYAAEYMTTHVATLTDSTQRSYEKNLRLHILPALGTRRLTDLTHREVQRFASSLWAGGKGLAPKTVHTVFGTLHALLTAAQRDEILQRNVADFCSLPRVTQTRAKAITSAELNQFLDLIRKDEFYYLFFLDIFSGMRQSEILGLRWADIDWDRNSLVVRKQLQQKCKKGDYSYTLIDPKENKQRRIILAETAMLTLQKQRTKQQRQRLAAGPLWNNPFDLVFTNEFGRALNHQTVYKHLKRLLRSCGMGDYTFHSLRHSFATISLENGDDIKTVQTNLGHSTAAFTLKTYAHVSDQIQRSSAARMEELISSLEAVN